MHCRRIFGLLVVLLASHAAVAQTPRAKGFVREPDVVYRSFNMTPRFRAFLPAEVDLSAGFPTPRDQGQQSSCTAWAVGYALRSYYEGKRHNWTFASESQLISPAYIYNRLHNFTGDCSEGTAISTALELLKDDGAVTLDALPYLENDCSRQPDAALTGTLSRFRISSFRVLDAKRHDDAKGQIHLGNPVVFGMDVSESFEQIKGDAVYNDTTTPRTGGHAMVIVGYSESRQAFKIMNSWGTHWGDNGFGWVSYNAMKQLTDQQFVVQVSDDVSPPKPVPAPLVVKPPAPPKPDPVPVVVTPPAPVPLPPKPVVVVPPAPPKPDPVLVVVAPPPAPVPPPPKPVVVVPPAPPKPDPVQVVVTPPPAPVPPPPKPVVVAPSKPDPVQVVVAPPPAPVPPPPKPVVVAPPKPDPVQVVVAPPPAPVPPPPKPVVVVPPAPVIPSVSAVREQVAARARELQCAKIDSTVSADRAARLRGFVGSESDLSQLQASLATMPGVQRVDADVRVYPWPQCEVFLSFATALAARGSLNATVRGGATLTDGDSLAIDVVTPAYPSYVYVSYLQANGEVVHLNWPEGRFPKALPPNAKITFGGGVKGQPVYRIGKPFGDEIVVVITSASPLFLDEPAETVTEREYLTSFRRAFLVEPKSGGGRRVFSAVALPLKTQAKP